jgi:hypothetical protein
MSKKRSSGLTCCMAMVVSLFPDVAGRHSKSLLELTEPRIRYPWTHLGNKTRFLPQIVARIGAAKRRLRPCRFACIESGRAANAAQLLVVVAVWRGKEAESARVKYWRRALGATVRNCNALAADAIC